MNCKCQSTPVWQHTLPFKLTNSNDGQGHSWHRTNTQRKKLGELVKREIGICEPFGELIDLCIVRILGPRQKLWDPSSVLRGNSKQLIDALVKDAELFWDDSSKFIRRCWGEQEVPEKRTKPLVRIEVYEVPK